MDFKVGILAIGNEVVEGQILNRNAAWLSEQMENLGTHVVYHLCCRDQDDEIQQSLLFLENNCQLILVSGGLGPTQDDRTRPNIAHWSQLPLELNEDYWKKIQNKLSQRQLTLRDGHKNQAYLPQTSQILANETGVAPGFFIKKNKTFLASLPGPPDELQPMFLNYLKPLILSELKPSSEQKLYTWICLGLPESEVAHIVESLVGDRLGLGFRLHKPYVEVKIWAEKELTATTQKLFSLIEEKLSPWVVGKSIQQIRQQFSLFLKQFKKVYVVDHLSRGLFLEKIAEAEALHHLRYQSFEQESSRMFSEAEVHLFKERMPVQKNELLICLLPKDEHSLWLATQNEVKTIVLPRNIKIQSPLGQHYALEYCFLNLKKV